MSSSWRQGMRETRAAEADRYLDELGSEERDSVEIEAERRAAQLETLREFDPGATLDATLDEELRLRLTGAETERGALRFSWGDTMLKPLEEGVSAAAHTSVELELTGVSHGSTVVHARPVVAAPADREGLGPVTTSPADQGIRTFVRLLTALEEEGDVREWAEILGPVDALAAALDRFDLSLGLTWYASDGAIRQAALTEHGRQYAKRLRKTRDVDQEIVVSGRITELRSSGVVKVKSGLAHNASAYEVRFDPDQLVSMRLVLGADVHFLVRYRRLLDAVGRTRSTEYHFLRQAAEDLTMDAPGE